MPVEAYRDYLLTILAEHLPESGVTWLQNQLAAAASEKTFHLAFSAAPRFVGKQPLRLAPEQLAAAGRLRAGFNPAAWTADQAARTVLLLQAPHQSAADYAARLNRLFSTADLAELAALYAALPL